MFWIVVCASMLWLLQTLEHLELTVVANLFFNFFTISLSAERSKTLTCPGVHTHFPDDNFWNILWLQYKIVPLKEYVYQQIKCSVTNMLFCWSVMNWCDEPDGSIRHTVDVSRYKLVAVWRKQETATCMTTPTVDDCCMHMAFPKLFPGSSPSEVAPIHLLLWCLPSVVKTVHWELMYLPGCMWFCWLENRNSSWHHSLKVTMLVSEKCSKLHHVPSSAWNSTIILYFHVSVLQSCLATFRTTIHNSKGRGLHVYHVYMQ